MEIGDLCKINMDDLVYKITNSKTKNVTLRPDKDTTHQIIEHFFDLEAVEDSSIKVKDVPIYNLSKYQE